MRSLTASRHRTSLPLALAAGLLLVLTACGDGGTEDDEPENGDTEETDTETGADDGDPEGAEADPDPVTLSFVTPLPENAAEHLGFWNWVEILEEEAPWVEIDYRGGPEVIAAFDQIDAVGAGSIDGAPLPEVYYDAQVPPVAMMPMTPYLPDEERENGIFEIYQRFHEELANVHYLGKVYAGIPFMLFTNEDVTAADLSGQIIRSGGANAAMVEALGGEPLNLPAPELYTALERGTTDGYIFASVGSEGNSWHELVEYEVSPRFYTTNMNLLLNQDTWNELDERTQRVLAETAATNEQEVVEMYQERALEETQAYRDAGVEVAELTGEERARFLEAAYVDGWEGIDWDDIVAQVGDVQEVRDLFEEGYGEDFSTAVPALDLFE